MDMIGQGLVLMLFGMGIVYLFLGILIVVTRVSCSWIARFDSILPAEPSKKPTAKTKAAGDDADVALAIAVAMNR